jgi:hypothetical protein
MKRPARPAATGGTRPARRSLLTYPLLSLPTGQLGGIPATYLYLFGVWAGLIALAAGVTERKEK